VRDRRGSRRDGGFTVIEVLIVVTLMGLITATLSAAIIVILKATPSTGLRIDDARTLRGMSTWLAQDVTSTPPFIPEDSNGGIDTSPGRNDCAAPGSNVLNLSWSEYNGSGTRRYIASYRYITDASGARIARYICSSPDGVTYGGGRSTNLTSGLSTTQPPTASFDTDAFGRVTVVKVRLYGASGEQVIVDTSSRNPAAYLP
jgi:prepilin-type N-terminal cleavage/methylation domain-containing protein